MSLSLIPDRSCGTCTLCCKVQGIQALQKPPGKMCPNCVAGQGCTIYASRPRECATFYCAWRVWPALGQHWFPADSRLMVIVSPESRHVLVTADSDRPDAWTQAPYYSEIKSMARDMVPHGFKIAVQARGELIFILPERDINLGVVADDETVEFGRIMTPSGPQMDVRKVKVARPAGGRPYTR